MVETIAIFEEMDENYKDEIFLVLKMMKENQITNEQEYARILKNKLNNELSQEILKTLNFETMKRLIQSKAGQSTAEIWNFIFENIKNGNPIEIDEEPKKAKIKEENKNEEMQNDEKGSNLKKEKSEIIKKSKNDEKSENSGIENPRKSDISKSKDEKNNEDSSNLKKNFEKESQISLTKSIKSNKNNNSSEPESDKTILRGQKRSRSERQPKNQLESDINEESKVKESKISDKDLRIKSKKKTEISKKDIESNEKSNFSEKSKISKINSDSNESEISEIKEKKKEMVITISSENNEKTTFNFSGSKDKKRQIKQISELDESEIIKEEANNERENKNQQLKESPNQKQISSIKNSVNLEKDSYFSKNESDKQEEEEEEEESDGLSPVESEEEEKGSNKKPSDIKNQRKQKKIKNNEKKEQKDSENNSEKDEKNKKSKNSNKNEKPDILERMRQKEAENKNNPPKPPPAKNKPRIIEEISASDLKIELRMNFPFQKDEYGQVLLKYMSLDFEGDKNKKGFLNIFLKELLKSVISSPIPNSKECDLVPAKTREDKFGPWKFDNLFDLMRIIAVFKDNEKTFPSFWRLKEEKQPDFDILKIEPQEKNSIPIDENMPIEDFFRMIGDKTQKKRATAQITKTFIEADVMTVKDLINIKKTTPDTFDKFFGIKFEIYEELEEIATQSKMRVLKGMNNEKKEEFFKDPKKKIEFRGKAYKVLRFFYYTINCESEMAFLDAGILEDSYNFILEDFKNLSLMNKIKDFYRPMTISHKGEEFKPPRGILFYGPPGSGKTTVAEKFPNLIGLTAICNSLASTELNRSLVGETEELIKQIFERALHYPHLLCYLSIDEIDAMVPRRDDKDNKNKGDTVNTILSLIGGNKDVPNLILIASTNFLKKIDEAISRRLSGKFFVGRMDKIAREGLIVKLVNLSIDLEELKKKIKREKKQEEKYKKLFDKNHVPKPAKMPRKVQEKINQSNLLDVPPEKDKDLSDSSNLFHSAIMDKIEGKEDNNEKKDKKKGPINYVTGINKNILEQVNVALINFTPAAIENFAGQIKAKIEKSNDPENLDIPQMEELLEMAKISSQQINIKFGTFFIPELYLNAKLFEKPRPKLEIPENSKGLVIIDLLSKVYNFKAETRNSPKDNFSIRFVERKIGKTSTANINDIIDDIAKFVDDNDIHAMQLIDLQSLVNNQAFDEQKTLENINEVLIEMKEYPNSLLVFDLDSLVTVTVSESNSGMGISTSYGMNNHKLFYYIKDLANSQSFVRYNAQKKPINSFWIFLVSREAYLLKMLKSALAIDLSKEETEKNEKQKQADGKKLKCVRCKKSYLQKENKTVDMCQHHIGYLFDKSLDPLECRMLDFYDDEDKKEIDMITISNQKKKNDGLDSDDEGKDEKDDQNPLWHICCWKGFNEQGCLNDFHTDDQAKFNEEREREKIKCEEKLEDYKDSLMTKL